MITVTIKWGTDGEVTKTYHFTNKQQYKWFMKGVDEAEGWLKYEIVEDEDDVPKWRYTKKRVNSWEVKDDLKNRILEKEDELPPAEEDKPEAGKIYALTGDPGSKCIANGNSWAESAIGEEVKPKKDSERIWSYRKNKDGFMGSENRVMKK